MDFYIISPVSNLQLMKSGDRIFALAHLWIQFPEYRKFIKSCQKEGKWITLDNSAAERSLVTEDVLIDICKELMPNEVIAPDILFDKDATIENAKLFKARMDKEKLTNRIDFFFCPQGKTKQDWLDAYMWGVDQDWIHCIGFSKIAIPQAWLPDWKDDQGIKEARHMAYDYLLEKKALKKPIHCLGQGDPSEFMYYDHPMMRSTDSVYPVWAGLNEQTFMNDTTTRTPTPHKLLETYDMSKLSALQAECIHSNIQILKLFCTYQQRKKAGLI